METIVQLLHNIQGATESRRNEVVFKCRKLSISKVHQTLRQSWKSETVHTLELTSVVGSTVLFFTNAF